MQKLSSLSRKATPSNRLHSTRVPCQIRASVAKPLSRQSKSTHSHHQAVLPYRRYSSNLSHQNNKAHYQNGPIISKRTRFSTLRITVPKVQTPLRTQTGACYSLSISMPRFQIPRSHFSSLMTMPSRTSSISLLTKLQLSSSAIPQRRSFVKFLEDQSPSHEVIDKIRDHITNIEAVHAQGQVPQIPELRQFLTIVQANTVQRDSAKWLLGQLEQLKENEELCPNKSKQDFQINLQNLIKILFFHYPKQNGSYFYRFEQRKKPLDESFLEELSLQVNQLKSLY